MTETALIAELRQLRLVNSALYREQVLAGARYADPLRLSRFGAKVFSQGDEDGLLAETFRRIGTAGRRFVEIGVEPRECNTRFLLVNGWSGAWIDAADRDLAPVAREVADGRLRFVRATVTRENVNALVGETAGAGALDLLSIDIDGNDYWVWEALEAARPRVVVVEYNATFPPPVSVVVPYDPGRAWDGTSHFGASLEALSRLGARKGYALVGCSFTGVNALFVRTELAAGKFRAPFTADEHYEPPRYFVRLSAGHPPGAGPLVEVS